MSNKNRPKVLVAPLNWGLGHASRCVPIINDLLKQDHEVILCAHGRSESFMIIEFPGLEFVKSPGYNIRYSSFFPMWFMILIQSPLLLLNIYLEHQWLKRFISNRNIDKVISDNRYGLWSKKTHCIFITHQVMIKCPAMLNFLEGILHRIVLWFMNKYDECWIPDVAGTENLSGDLSHKYPSPANTKFIGWLSRFQPTLQDNTIDYTYVVCCILSGPEPLRTELENIILSCSASFRKKVLLVQGKPEENNFRDSTDNLSIISHLGHKELEHAIRISEVIVCRAGYTSIMDMQILGKKTVLIPTPGQTEQEYLAKHLSQSGLFESISQKDFEEKYLNKYLLTGSAKNPEFKASEDLAT